MLTFAIPMHPDAFVFQKATTTGLQGVQPAGKQNGGASVDPAPPPFFYLVDFVMSKCIFLVVV